MIDRCNIRYYTKRTDGLVDGETNTFMEEFHHVQNKKENYVRNCAQK